MKKIILFIAMILLVASTAQAAWTLKVKDLGYKMDNHIYSFEILCTSDGSAMSATDLLGISVAGVPNVDGMTYEIRKKIMQCMLMVMTVDPGTGGVAPDTTIDITLGELSGKPQYSHATFPATFDVASSYGKLYEDFGQYIPVGATLYATISDIGTAGDQVTLRFDGWVEDK